MKLLIDESAPEQLRLLFPEHDVQTVGYRGWKSKGNGELIALARDEFDAIITTDRKMPSQQNITPRDVAVVVLAAKSNDLADLALMVPQALAALQTIRRGQIIVIDA